MARVYLGFGANLGDPIAALAAAAEGLENVGIRLLRRARLYSTAPVGPQDQPRFTNTVLEVETALEPHELLRALKAIEAEQGRVTTVRWGPRVLDLDILLYEERQMATPELIIPHRELPHRGFVLVPLAELAPELVIPGVGQTVRALLAALPRGSEDVVPLPDAEA